MDDVTWTRRAHDRDLSRLEMCHVTMWRRVFGRVKVKMYRYTLIVINFISKTKWTRDRHLRDLRLQVTWKKKFKIFTKFQNVQTKFPMFFCIDPHSEFQSLKNIFEIFTKFWIFEILFKNGRKSRKLNFGFRHIWGGGICHFFTAVSYQITPV